MVSDIFKYADYKKSIEDKKYVNMSEKEIIMEKAVDIYDQKNRVFLPSLLPAY